MIYYAEGNSRNYTFNAVSDTRERALATLIKGMQAHAKKRGLATDWWQDAVEIQIQEMELNKPYKDYEVIE